jgi:hypothetical protein
MKNMNDIVVPSKDDFETQAKLHESIRDGLQTFVNSFDPKHNTIVDHLDKDQVEQYRQWWQAFRSKLLNHADVHDKLAQHLRGASDAFHGLDTSYGQNLKSMTKP